jgi:hypothetical protein
MTTSKGNTTPLSIDSIVQSIPMAEASKAVTLAVNDRSTRSRQRTVPRIIRFSSAANESMNKDALLPMPGTVSLYLATPGSQFLRTFENALTIADEPELKRLYKLQANTITNSRTLGVVGDYADEVINAAAYFDFGYGKKSLAEFISLPPNVNFTSIRFPYNGGELNMEDFFLDEYYHDGKRSTPDVLVVIAEPKLSDFEKAALAVVPKNDLEGNIGKPPINPLLPTTVMIVGIITIELAAAAYAWVTCCGCRVQGHVERKLAAVNSKKYLSARELTEIRAKALLEENIF